MSKHKEIYDALSSEIAAGTYNTNRRVPSEAQLVRRFGVSRPTAARALRELQKEGLVERRAEAGSFLADEGKASPEKFSKHLGVLVPNRDESEIFDVIFGELASLARVRGYSLVLGGSNRIKAHQSVTPRDAEEVCQQFIEHNIAGVFFSPFEFSEDMGVASKRTAERLHAAGICVILLDRDIVSYPLRSNFDLISVDNPVVGYLSAEHLITHGREELRLRRPPELRTDRARASFGSERRAHCGKPRCSPQFPSDRRSCGPRLRSKTSDDTRRAGVRSARTTSLRRSSCARSAS